jgi:hypothetical protein
VNRAVLYPKHGKKEATKLKPKSENKKRDEFRKNVLFLHTPRTHTHTHPFPSFPSPVACLQSSLLPSTLSPCFSRTLTNPSTRRRGPRSNPPEPRARDRPAPLPESLGRSSVRTRCCLPTPARVAVALAACMIARGGGGGGAGGGD